MGTWGVSKEELIGKLVDCLDDIEGDFDTNTLKEALEFMCWYGFTSDSPAGTQKVWKRKLLSLNERGTDNE